MARVSISTGCLPRLEGKQFYKLDSIVRMIRRFLKESVVDGFEFVLLPEWDAERAPLTPTSAPPDCEKHAVAEVLEAVEGKDFPILSVHANRDIGNYLCSESEEMRSKGIRLIDECLDFAKMVGSGVCVFHFWDTWKESLDFPYLQSIYDRFQRAYRDVEVSVENIPTKSSGSSPFRAMCHFGGKTLDLKWASMYGEFDDFLSVLGEVNNVHVQGLLEGGRLVASVGKLDFDIALEGIRRGGYDGLFTVELEGMASFGDVARYVERLKKRVSWSV